MLEVSHLCAGYGKRLIIHDFSARFEPGRLYILLGPNGSGKTTLLNCLGGWKKAESGTIAIQNQPLQTMNTIRRAVFTGRAAANPSAIEMPLERFVQAGGYARQKSEGAKAVELSSSQALERLHLAGLEQRYLDELSAGQAQKAAIAQLLVQDPVCFFLDEPGSSLDPRARFELMDLLTSLKDDRRIMILIVHDLDLALRYGDTILVLDQGKKVFEGPPEKLVSSHILESVFSIRLEDWDPRTKTGRIFPALQKQIPDDGNPAGPANEEIPHRDKREKEENNEA